MDNNSLKEAARKELLRRAAEKELKRRRMFSDAATSGDKTGDSTSLSDYGMDVLRGAGTGIVKGATGLLGTAGDVQQMTGDVLSWGAEKLGFSPEIQAVAETFGKRMAIPGMSDMPTSKALMEPIEENFGPLPEAKTLPGQIAERMGEYSTAAIGGPGSFGRRVAMVAAPAFTSELAGRIPVVEGSPYQPYVESVVGAVTGLPVALGGKGAALKEMRENAPRKEIVSDLKKEAYDKLDNAGIMYDSVSTRRAVSNIRSGLSRRGVNVAGDSPAISLYRNVENLLKGKNSRSWTNVDRILQEGKSILRSDEKPTIKGDVAVIVSNLENLVKSGKLTSTSGLSRDEINNTINAARELARRDIISSEIVEMKRRLPGYVTGDTSGSRNQFGSYIRSPEGRSLKKAEEDAFSKVVRREGFLDLAQNMGSRIGQIAGAGTGAGVGGITGATFGPLGAVIGSGVGAAATAGTQLAFRKAMESVTEKAVDDALKTVLAGREAQGIALNKTEIEKLRAKIRANLILEATTRPAREELVPLEIEIPGGDLPVSAAEEPAQQASGGRIARKSGGRTTGNAISAEVKRVRALLSEKTASMLSVPDDAIATALHLAKRT